jgi:hypothetical protein
LNDQKVRGEVRSIPVEEAETRLRIFGNQLWSRFLPDDFQLHYYNERDEWRGKSVIVYTNEPWIPWELIRPYQVDKAWESDAPWCETMLLTRWLQMDSQPQGIPGTLPLKLRMGGLTLIVPKNSKLESAKDERAFMLKFRHNHKLKDDGVEPVTNAAVLKALEQPYDWVHAAAHGFCWEREPERRRCFSTRVRSRRAISTASKSNGRSCRPLRSSSTPVR